MNPEEVWQSIIKLQLDGVMMHITLFEQFNIANLQGYKYLHKCHAQEEFEKYLHVVNDYIEKYNAIPVSENVAAPTVSIQGTTEEEKMINGMELYKNWEHGVCTKLKIFQKQFTEEEDQEHVNYLIEDVHEELKYINLMCNDLLDGKYEELNNWLIKNFKGHC